MKNAVCLLSGGLDSAVCLYVAQSEGYAPVALSFRYGQRHERELIAARRLCKDLNIRHFVLPFQLPWQGSALLDKTQELPQDRSLEEIPNEIPATYVPARNSIFLAMAMSCAEAFGANAVFIGANALDYSGYPDCRPDYLRAFEEAMRQGTKTGAEGHPVRIHAPLLHLTKKDIVLLGKKLHVPFENTWSCYEGGAEPCGHCDSCRLRAKGFQEAGFSDPLLDFKPVFSMAETANITEIFSSLQGEGLRTGERHLFIRFQDCPMQCSYCDEIDKKGIEMSLAQLLQEVERVDRDEGPHAFVSLTGGEPLFYRPFLKALCHELKVRNRKILLETNGVLWETLSEIVGYCDLIAMDLKLPSVGHTQDLLREHRKFLKVARDKETFIKIVVSKEIDLKEYEEHLRMVSEIAPLTPIFLQPVSLAVESPEDPELILLLEELQRIGKRWVPDIRIGLRLHKMLKIR